MGMPLILQAKTIEPVAQEEMLRDDKSTQIGFSLTTLYVNLLAVPESKSRQSLNSLHNNV